jgi:hypothetical protein
MVYIGLVGIVGMLMLTGAIGDIVCAAVGLTVGIALIPPIATPSEGKFEFKGCGDCGEYGEAA